jgi:uncharacterized protein with GYD domain
MTMPKFLFEASYTAEGVAGVAAKGGTARREAIEQLFDSSGGKLEAFYFAFGHADVYAIGELPDNETAAAIALAINRDGRTTVSTVVLLTPEEIDSAARKTVAYRAPGA